MHPFKNAIFVFVFQFSLFFCIGTTSTPESTSIANTVCKKSFCDDQCWRQYLRPCKENHNCWVQQPSDYPEFLPVIMVQIITAALSSFTLSAAAASHFRLETPPISDTLAVQDLLKAEFMKAIPNTSMDVTASEMKIIPQATAYAYAATNFYTDASCSNFIYASGVYPDTCARSRISSLEVIYSRSSVSQSATTGTLTTNYYTDPSCSIPASAGFPQESTSGSLTCTASTKGGFYSQVYAGSSVTHGSSAAIYDR